MIQVTRLNGKSFYINPHIIESIEETPNTVITYVTGVKVVVLEPVQEIIQRIKEYRRTLMEAGREVLPSSVFREDNESSEAKINVLPATTE